MASAPVVHSGEFLWTVGRASRPLAESSLAASDIFDWTAAAVATGAVPHSGLPGSAAIPATVQAVTAIFGPTALTPTETARGSEEFLPSATQFAETGNFADTRGLAESRSFTASRTFLRSPDLIASDSFETTIGVAGDNADAGTAGAVEYSTLAAIAAAALAAIVLLGLLIWRRRRDKGLLIDPENEAYEGMTEFTWEAHVENLFTSELATYESPHAGVVSWDEGHFTQVLTAAEGDPFTQFE
jgi:hypothetical protein